MTTEKNRIDRVTEAIMKAWADCGEVPFPLYKREARKIARAVIAAMDEGRVCDEAQL